MALSFKEYAPQRKCTKGLPTHWTPLTHLKQQTVQMVSLLFRLTMGAAPHLRIVPA